MNDKLLDVLYKKAFGFTYTEEVKEFETKTPKELLFCEKRNRLYSKSGFVKVLPTRKNNEIISFKNPKKRLKFARFPKILKFCKKS